MTTSFFTAMAGDTRLDEEGGKQEQSVAREAKELTDRVPDSNLLRLLDKIRLFTYRRPRPARSKETPPLR